MNRYYILEMFEPTLLYGFALALLGVAAAYSYGPFSASFAALAVVGAVLAQISVNVISDYFDYRSGLDRELAKVKSDELSGGSSLIAKGLIKPGATLVAGLSAFSAAGAIGIYLLYYRPYLLPIAVIAGLSILLYSRYVKRVPYLSEQLCSLNYLLIPYGSFIAATGASRLPLALAFAFVPSGIMLGGTALFVNSVPDRSIDSKYGARHTAVMLSTNQNIGSYYLAAQSVSFALIAFGIAFGALPKIAIAAFAVLPATYYVFKGLYEGNRRKYGKYLVVHTLASFVLALLLSVSFAIMRIAL
ncbi:MAG: prenyltransferase [Candidatus Micrarchaeaceae archaeon]